MIEAITPRRLDVAEAERIRVRRVRLAVSVDIAALSRAVRRPWIHSADPALRQPRPEITHRRRHRAAADT